MHRTLSILVFICWKLSQVQACNGISLQMSNTRNCGGENEIIKMLNRSFQINEKCEIFSRSCAYVLRYNTAQLSVEVHDRELLVYQAKVNICDKKKKIPDLILAAIAGWGIPNFCPIKKSSTFCYKGEKLGKLSPGTQRMVEFLSTLKEMKIKIMIEHNTGNSCFEAMTRIMKTSN